MFLQIQNISKSYDAASVLQQIDFEVNRGEIVGILGESGSGKSTLLRIIAGLTDPDGGQILLKKKILPTASDNLIAGHPAIKIVHQEYNLYPQLTAFENIAYMLRFYEKPYQQARTSELIALCHLENVADRPTKLLSGGEKQRTAIACALAEKPKVLLLDEPFAHIDLPDRNRLSRTVQKLVKQLGIACIFVTHDSAEALALSHRLGVLRAGQLIQIDSPENIYHRPLNSHVAALSGEVNLLKIKTFQEIFGKTNAQILTDKKVALRPESIEICSVDSQQPTADSWVVKSSIFYGGYYKIQLVKNSLFLYVYSNKNWEQGQQAALRVYE